MDDAAIVAPRAAAHRGGRALALALLFALGAVGAFAGHVAAPRFVPAGLAAWESSAPWRGGLPQASEWPREAGPAESVRLEDGAVVVAARTPQEARRLAAGLSARRLAGVAEVARRRAALRARAAAELVEGPLPALATASQAAALLRGRARAMRGIAGPDPGLDDALPDLPLMAAAWAGLEAAAASGDPESVAVALAAAAGAERAWIEREAAAAPYGDPGVDARWRTYAHRRAEVLDAWATVLEKDLTPLQRELVDLTAPSHAIRLAPDMPDPAAATLAAGAPPEASPARVSKLARDAHTAAGGMIGLVAGLAIAAAAWPRRRAPAPDAPAPAPDLGRAWLHLVGGRLARGTMELAARSAARGGRTLVVDAARGAGLHRAWGVGSRLGFVDCLEERMPVLGLCQHGGLPGVFVLAYGEARRRPQWTQLDRLLEEARPHFDRVILALGPDTPREVGSILSGRVMEGWWAVSRQGLPRAADRLEYRVGIRFGRLDLQSMPKASLEALRERFAELAPHLPAPAPGEPAVAAEAAALPALHAPAVLDCDLQVRERLRFLAWMRRVRAESRPETFEPARRA
uniref:CpsD/CapB family tyrosine-protein kinase n=1 Tax=Eiseniibacteriota bacterium TaxID=2212470 RepID=A0A832MKS6_UNCEI